MRDVITIPEVAIPMGDFIMVLDEDMGEFDSTEKLALTALSRLRDAHAADVQYYTEGCLEGGCIGPNDRPHDKFAQIFDLLKIANARVGVWRESQVAPGGLIFWPPPYPAMAVANLPSG